MLSEVVLPLCCCCLLCLAHLLVLLGLGDPVNLLPPLGLRSFECDIREAGELWASWSANLFPLNDLNCLEDDRLGVLIG